MTARELLAWGDREDRRRRAARGGLGALPPLVWSLVAAVALTAELARRIDAGEGLAASQLWVAVAIVEFAVVVFTAPFRMYWRHDSAFLARLAIDGGALYRLAFARSLRAAALAAIPCAVGACAFGVMTDWEIALRHLALCGAAATAAGLLGPSVALFAGALIASDRAMALVESVAGGEIGAPKTTWLGMFPGLAATAIGALLLAAAGWIAGGSVTALGGPEVLFAVALGVPLLLALAAWVRAPAAMLAAVREVAALDTVRLAHIDLSSASSLERGWARATLPADDRAVFDKDARLARRRYPAPYFLSAVCVVALWVVAAVVPDDLYTWSGALLGCLAVYAVVMARRLVAPPVEHPGYLATLAIAPAAAVRAKRSAIALRVVATLVLGGAPLIARAPEPVPIGIAVAAIVALTLGASFAALGRGRAAAGG